MSARRAIAALALLVLVFSCVWPLGRDGVRRASRGLRGDDSRLEGTGFAFDRAYGPFLYAADAAAPPGSPIAVAAPRTSELYVYQAHYTLAPRRVAAASDRTRYIAVYGAGGPPAAAARSLPGGVLLLRP